MPGNRRVFVSHTHEDNELCVPLLAALDAWGVDYWFDTEQLDPGSQLSERIQQALNERDIFLRVCTPAAQQSFWMGQELAAAQGMRADARSRGQADRRKIVFLVLAPGYVQAPNEQADVVIDATGSSRAETLKQLRVALGVPLPERRISRRALLGGGAAGAAVVVGATAAGTLYLTKDVAPSVPAVLPTSRLPVPTATPTANRLKWYFKAAGGDTGDQKVYGLAVSGNSLLVSTDDGVYALGASDGGILWTTAQTVSPRSAAAVSGDTAYVSGEDNSAFSTVLVALNTGDGRARWTTQLDDSSATAPAAGRGLICVVTSKTVSVFSATDGSIVWKQPVPPQSNNGLQGQPTIASGVLYFAGPDNAMYALDAQSGTQIWRQPLRANVSSAPTVVNGGVYFGTSYEDGAIYALNSADGSQRWRVAVGSGYGRADGGAAVSNDVVYAGTDQGVLYALDAETGKAHWQVFAYDNTADNTAVEAISSRPLVTGDNVYVTTSNYKSAGPNLRALAQKDGSKLWVYTGMPVPYTGALTPVLIGGTVYFSGGSDHAVYAVGV